ncbi:MAG: Uma2 family endonuclease [Myxococcales bacterium]|nr:Uma2 family endonuclease [Myxococcales bacterium]
MQVRRREDGFRIVEARQLEEAQPLLRMELIDGVLYSMGRATPWHAAMTAGLIQAIGGQLQSDCRAYAESLAVGAAEHDATYVHPDVTIVCGPLVTHPEEPTVVLNPRAVFEVLSPGTALRDRNEKLAKYQSIPAIQAIVYLEYERRLVIAWLRLEDGWHQIEREPGRTLEVPEPAISLDVGALYAQAEPAGGPPAS